MSGQMKSKYKKHGWKSVIIVETKSWLVEKYGSKIESRVQT
jgi:hypothetical protein